MIVDEELLDKALALDWEVTPENFVTFARLILNLPPDGPPPFATLAEALRNAARR